MISIILSRLCYGLRDLVSVVLYFIVNPDAREDASLRGLIREEFFDAIPLTPTEDLRRLKTQLSDWNSRHLNKVEPSRAIAIYGIHVRGSDDGAIYRSRVVRGWHQRRMRRLSKYFRVSGLAVESLRDIQKEIDRLKAAYPSAEILLVTCTSHGISGELYPYMSPRSLQGLSQHASFVVDACEIAQGDDHFISRMARLNPGLRCWGAQEPGGNATIYFKRIEGTYRVRAVYWFEDLLSLFWGRAFVCCREEIRETKSS